MSNFYLLYFNTKFFKVLSITYHKNLTKNFKFSDILILRMASVSFKFEITLSFLFLNLVRLAFISSFLTISFKIP